MSEVSAGALVSEDVARPLERGTGRIEAIDGLRGLACLMVLYCHLYGAPKGFGFAKIDILGFQVEPTHLLSMGGSGVELFFVLSGFCLAYPLMMRGADQADWKRYFFNRARRILPPYWAAYLLWALTYWLVQRTEVHPWVETHMGGEVSRLKFWQGFFLLHIVYSGIFWTLVVEARWYLALPLLMMLYFRLPNARYRGAAVFAVTVFISLAWGPIGAMPKWGQILRQVFSALPPALWCFGAGMWVADITRRQAQSGQLSRMVKIAVPMLVLTIVLLFVPIPPAWKLEEARHGLWTVLYFFLVLAALHSPATKRMFSWPPLVSAGLFSYSLYLTHLWVIDLVYPVVRPLDWTPWMKLIFYTGVLGPCCIGFGYLFYLVAEKPFLTKPPSKPKV